MNPVYAVYVLITTVGIAVGGTMLYSAKMRQEVTLCEASAEVARFSSGQEAAKLSFQRCVDKI
jgi:tRNA A37 N6-isopentenylltransferase MiaA